MGQSRIKDIIAREAKTMKKQTRVWLALAAILVVIATFLAYRKWNVPSRSAREEALALMPDDASAVLFVDF